MVIGALAQIQHPHSPILPDSQLKSAGRSGNILPPEHREANVNISERGRLTLECEMQNIAEARENQEFIDFRGHDGKIRLGLMALGKTMMDGWSAKGLEITEKSILAAAEAFQDAFRKNLEENGPSTAGTAISLNRYQIVINTQAVPDWFIEEYQRTLSSMGDSKLKSAFENGDTFFVSPPSALTSEALGRYADVKNNI